MSDQTDMIANDGASPHPPGSEFEREPVPQRAWLPLSSFLGQYAGEHIAGTELMIGPLFVAAGVGARDLLWGLLVGNVLAVLSWTFLTAPIATRARLTLYYQLELICGRRLVALYNLANGVMFCFLAGAMITVSATAAGVAIDFQMPGLEDLYPSSLGWVLAAAVVGALISLVAAYGYATLARFANYAVPWLVLVFVAFGVLGLSELGLSSLGELPALATAKIWRGGAPLAGQTKFTFWHVMFFAWFCNMAMHIGMADLTILRFARRSWYGAASAAGMFLGHYMAWVSASILYAVQLDADPGNTNVLPGPMAYRVCGIAGLACVVIAGWTTANPTIYRAGLAFQGMFPKSSRVSMTLLAGGLATIAGVFPAVAMKLLGFVALYGLVLMPMGAVLFADYWVFPRLGLTGNWAQRTGAAVNRAAAAVWLLTLALCLGLTQFAGVPIYFVGLPGWFFAVALYLALGWLRGER